MASEVINYTETPDWDEKARELPSPLRQHSPRTDFSEGIIKAEIVVPVRKAADRVKDGEFSR